MFQRLLLLWLVLLCWVAYEWPEWFPAALDPFVETKKLGLLDPVFALAMFAIGGLLPAAEVDAVARRWPTVLGGTAVQYLAMPLLAFAVGHAFALPGDLLAGVIIVGCVPGAMASNVLTHAAGGNTSYSVGLTTSATLLSPLVVPFALWVALDAETSVDPLRTSLHLAGTLVAPVVTGHLLSRSLPRFERLAAKVGPVLANLVLLWIIAVVVGLLRDRLAVITPRVVLALLAVNVLGYLAGAVGGRILRLSGSMRRALVLEVGMQNAGMGTLLVLAELTDHPAAAIPTAGYTFGCMLTGTALASFWAGRPTRDTPSTPASSSAEREQPAGDASDDDQRAQEQRDAEA